MIRYSLRSVSHIQNGNCAKVLTESVLVLNGHVIILTPLGENLQIFKILSFMKNSQ